MKLLDKVFRRLSNPKLILFDILYFIAPLIKNDQTYIKMRWKLSMDYRLNLEDPRTYNEKLQWLKLYDRRPEYVKMVDKYEAKELVSSIIGSQYIIPTLSVYDSVEDIDFDKLPNQFVLKCTHDSGGVVICRDKDSLNIEKAKKKLSHGLKHNFYYQNREWPYKQVKPRIIAERYMEDDNNELIDYKFFCFNGEVKALFIATDRQNSKEETKFDFFDENFKHLEVTNGHPNAINRPKKPISFDRMKELASKLSSGYPHIRVDFYEVNGEVYFGELTLCHWGGFVPFKPKEWDYTFGSWLKIK